MIAIESKATGPLFENPDLLSALLRGMQQGVEIMGQRVRASYRRGPGRFGHAADLWRTQVTTNGWDVTGRVFPQGKGAFKTLFLERGTVAHLIAARGYGTARGARKPLTIRAGGGMLFRQFAHHPGIAAGHQVERARAETWPIVQPLLAREVVKELGGAA